MKFTKNLIFLLILLAGTLLACFRWKSEQAFPVLKGETGLPAWDWIEWKDSPKGPVAVQVFKVAMNTPGSGIQTGDILKRIEYQTVPSKSLLNNILQASAPGKILIYQIERDDANQFNPVHLQILVPLAWRPFFTSTVSSLFWNIEFLLSLLLGFFTLIILLILYPLLQGSFKKNLPIIAVLGFTLIAFAWYALRTLRIRLDFPSMLIFQEQLFIVAWCAISCLIGISAFFALPGNRQWVKILPNLSILFGFLALCVNSIFQSEDYREHALTILNFCIFLISVNGLWFINSERESGIIKDFPWLKILALTALSAMLLIALLQLGSINLPDYFCTLSELICFPALFLPALDLSASRLKFGKATVVLTRTIQYLLFSGTIFLAYFLLSWLVEFLYAGAPYLEWITILLLIVVFLAGRGLYHRTKAKFNRLGVSFQPRQSEEIQHFIANIPRYTHSQDLIKDSIGNIKKYFGSQEVLFWLEELGTSSEQDNTHYLSVFKGLALPELFWSANKELNPLTLKAEDEQFLAQHNWSLALPLRFSRAKAGLLILGKKKKGVYNLEDLDLLRRISTQIWLTLDILYLLENEKMLMQKTMEANLTALRSQINPHFLFNTLNTISSLIHDNPEMAEQAVENLAFIFRYTLRTSGENFVTVEGEMTLVKKYLEIEEFRFGENLEVKIEIEETCKECELPALVIQTIVENCIKHGIAKILTKGIVSIRIIDLGDRYKTIIEDNGPGIRSDRISMGTGLNNIHSRLHSLYGNSDILTFENTGNGTRVTLTLPKKRHEK